MLMVPPYEPSAVPQYSSRACGLNHSIELDVLANVRQCFLTDKVFAPHVQHGSLPFGLRPIVFNHAGSTSWADAAGWADALGWFI